jgi:hypothetical protein
MSRTADRVCSTSELPVTDPNLLLSQIEQRHLWAYFHKEWLIEIRASLLKSLPAEYHVFIESETVLLSVEANGGVPRTAPDIAVARNKDQSAKAGLQQSAASAAVIEFEEPYELFTKYTLIIRRSPQNRVVAAMEMLSPSNKGIGSRTDREKYLFKRDSYAEAGINFLEIDALTEGERLLPDTLSPLRDYERNAWTALYDAQCRRIRGYGWNSNQRLPVICWEIERGVEGLIDLDQTARTALELNRWETLVKES